MSKCTQEIKISELGVLVIEEVNEPRQWPQHSAIRVSDVARQTVVWQAPDNETWLYQWAINIDGAKEHFLVRFAHQKKFFADSIILLRTLSSNATQYTTHKRLQVNSFLSRILALRMKYKKLLVEYVETLQRVIALMKE